MGNQRPSIQGAYRAGRWTLLGLLALVTAFVAANIVTAYVYRDRVYPRTYVAGQDIGGMRPEEAREELRRQVQEYRLQLKAGSYERAFSPAEIGLKIKPADTVSRARSGMRESRLAVQPIFDAFARENQQLVVERDEERLRGFARQVADEVSNPPRPARIEITEGEARIRESQTGTVLEAEAVREAVVSAVRTLSENVQLHPQPAEPELTSEGLQDALLRVRARLATPVQFLFGSRDFVATRTQKGTWLALNYEGEVRIQANRGEIGKYAALVAEQMNRPPSPRIVTLQGGEVVNVQEGRDGVRVKQDEMVEAIAGAMESAQALVAPLPVDITPAPTQERRIPEPTPEPEPEPAPEPQPQPQPQPPSQSQPQPAPQMTFTYCVAGRGVGSAAVSELAGAAANVYGNPNGWSLGGKVRFQAVQSGCDFTLWMAGADQVPSFGAACSAEYNCRAGRNVIINYARWQNAVAHWPASLAAYRTYAINHETGHWLGLGHRRCPAGGALAPVMEQQSISLNGCRPNAWPLEGEKRTMAGIHGIKY